MPDADTEFMACDGCGANVYGDPNAWLQIGVPEGKTREDCPTNIYDAAMQGFTLIVLCPACKAPQ